MIDDTRSWTAEVAAVLAGTKDPQHDYVAGIQVATGIRGDLVERAEARRTKQLAHAGVLAYRVAAGIGAKLLDRGRDACSLGEAVRPAPGWV